MCTHATSKHSSNVEQGPEIYRRSLKASYRPCHDSFLNGDVRHFPVSSATPGVGEDGSNCELKAPFHLRPKLDSKRAPSVGILVEVLFKKGLETRSKRGPKGDLKEEPSKNMEKVSSINYLLRFSRVGRSKKHHLFGLLSGSVFSEKSRS